MYSNISGGHVGILERNSITIGHQASSSPSEITGVIEGTEIAGGVIGHSEYSSIVIRQTTISSGTIRGGSFAGGLIGKLDNSYKNLTDEMKNNAMTYDKEGKKTLTQEIGTHSLGYGYAQFGDSEDAIIIDSSIYSNNGACGGVIGWTSAFNRIDFINIQVNSRLIKAGLTTKEDNHIAGGIIGEVAPDTHGSVMNFYKCQVGASQTNKDQQIEGYTVGGMIGQAGSALMSTNEGDWRNDASNGIYRFLQYNAVGLSDNKYYGVTYLVGEAIVGGIIGDGNPGNQYYEGENTGNIFNSSGERLEVDGSAACQKTYTFMYDWLKNKDKDDSYKIQIYKVCYLASSDDAMFDNCGFSIGRALKMANEDAWLNVTEWIDISKYQGNGLFYQDSWYTSSLDITFRGSDSIADATCVALDENGEKNCVNIWFKKDGLTDKTGDGYRDYLISFNTQPTIRESAYSLSPLS